MPETGEQGQWYTWIREFIYESKKLLTLRRKTPILRYASEMGFDAIERKEGVQIFLDDYDLNRSDYQEYYANQHRQRTEAFVNALLNKANAEELFEQKDDGKEQFLRRLRAD